MRNKFPFFKYVTGDSKVHLMNSKMKIIWLLLTILTIILINDYISLVIVTLFLVFIMENTKINLGAYISNLLLVWPIYVLILIISFSFSFNLLFGVLTALKVVLIVLIFLILTTTTSLSEIAWGFECLFEKLKKLGVPVSKISLRIAMDIKFVSTMFEEAKTIRKSMAYRGIPYNKNKIISFKRMIVPVISLSYKLSRRMVKIMKLRFYGNSKRRTNYHENKITKYDKILVFVPFVLIYIVIWLGWC